MPKLYACSTCWRRDVSGGHMLGHSIGYVQAENDDEARGMAVRDGQKAHQGYTMLDVSLIEIDPGDIAKAAAWHNADAATQRENAGVAGLTA